MDKIEQALERPTCTTCRESKPIEAFYMGKDGRHRPRCRECTRAAGAKWRAENKSQVAEAKAAYRRKTRTNANEHCRKYREQNREILRKKQSEYRARNREKRLAWDSVRHAVASGRLVRPDICEWCGAQGRIEATHHEYSRRLDVEWLCVVCHRKKDADIAAEQKMHAAAPELLHACKLIAYNAPRIAEWLAANDPHALAQVKAAITKATHPEQTP